MAKDYHKILGVSYNASKEEIKAAYKKLAKQWHPDKWLNDRAKKFQAEEKMKEINEAYDVLKNRKSESIPISLTSSKETPKSKYAKEEDIWDIDLEKLSRDYFGVKSNQETDKNKSKESLWFNSEEITRDFFGI